MPSYELFIGIDHAFSFPVTYFERYRLGSWPAFLVDFAAHWPTDEDHTNVDFIRFGTLPCVPGSPELGVRVGTSAELRLARTASAGTSDDLSQHRRRYPYVLPSGNKPSDIVGMGCPQDARYHYGWYRDAYRLGLRRRPAAMQAMQHSLNEVCCVSGA